MSSVFALILIVADNVSFGRLQIQSDVPCPTSADVSASLRRLLGAEPSTPLTLSVSAGEASLEVRLTDGNGATLSERTWPKSTDCAAAAQAIAVMTAAWAEDLPPVREALVAPPPSAVVATALAPPPRDATAAAPSRFTLRFGSGVASPISTGQASSRLIWAVPTLQVDAALRAAGTVAPFGSLGLFADLPRTHSSVGASWHRYTLEPMGGVAMSNRELSFAAGAGLSVGFVGDNDLGTTGTLFDAGVITEVRVGYTLDFGQGALGLWMSLRARAALEGRAYGAWGPLGPASPYEAGLLVGGDFSWLR